MLADWLTWLTDELCFDNTCSWQQSHLFSATAISRFCWSTQCCTVYLTFTPGCLLLEVARADANGHLCTCAVPWDKFWGIWSKLNDAKLNLWTTFIVKMCQNILGQPVLDLGWPAIYYDMVHYFEKSIDKLFINKIIRLIQLITWQIKV